MTAPQRVAVGRTPSQVARRAPASGTTAPRTTGLRAVPPLAPSPRVGLMVLVMAAMVFSILIGAALVHSNLITGQRQLDQLDAKTAEAHVEQERLRLQVAQLEAPDRIVAEAARQGMVAPDQIRWLAPVPPGPPGLSPASPSSGGELTPGSDLAAADDPDRANPGQ